MRILGIDPGSVVTGYGIIEVQDQELDCKDYGCIKTDRKADFQDRLCQIYDEVSRLVQESGPDFVAFEEIFYGRNVKSAIQLSHARGVAVVAAAKTGARLFYYAPREVKQAVTGFGGASKEQVQKMVQNLLRLPLPVTPLDASDALAIAICHAFRQKTVTIAND